MLKFSRWLRLRKIDSFLKYATSTLLSACIRWTNHCLNGVVETEVSMINSCEFSKMQEGKTEQDRGGRCHFCDVLDDIPDRYTMSLNGMVCFVVILDPVFP